VDPTRGGSTDAPDPAELEAAQRDPRRRLGRYVLLAELGRGAFGAVHQAWDPRVGRLVAVKVLTALSERARVRFRREVQALAAVRHPNIVGVHDCGVADERDFLVMELAAGEPLDAVARREGALEPRRAAALVRDLAEAVEAAHQRGVLHRDLKPANVIVDEETGQPRLLDFGLSAVVGADRITRSGVAMGTPSYMSPELATGRHDQVDARTDVYALGATLYHLLTGRPPFESSTLESTAEAVVRRPPPPIREVRGDVDPALEAVCLACLEKAPADRYPTAAALAADLDRWLRGEAVEARPRRSVRPAVAAGLVLAAVASAAVAWQLRPGPAGGEAAASPAGAASPADATPSPAGSGAPGADPAEARAALDEARDVASLGAAWGELAPLLAAARAAAGGEGPVAVEVELVAAERAYRRGRLAEARAALDRLAELPGRPEVAALRIRTAVLASADDREALAEATGRLLAADPDGPAGLVARGASALDAGQLAAALARAERALGLAPDDPEARLVAGRALSTLGRRREAVAQLERATTVAPDHAVAWRALARARLRGVEDLGGAEAALAAAERLESPPGPRLRCVRAEIHLRRGELDLAADALTAALAARPDDVRGRLLRGLLRRARGHDADARADWSTAHEAAPGPFRLEVRDLPASTRWAACEAAAVDELVVRAAACDLGWLTPAVLTATTARAAPAGPAAADPLRRALRGAARGRPWDEVEPELQAALVAAPSSPVVALESARLHVARDRSEAARAELERAAELAPDAAAELLRLEAELRMRRGDLEAALPRYAEAAALEAGPESATARVELGWMDGRPAEAVELADAALARWPDHGPTRLARAIGLLYVGSARETLAGATSVLGVDGARDARVLMVRAVAFGRVALEATEPDPEAIRAVLAEFGPARAATDGVSPRILAARFAFRTSATLPEAGELLEEARLLQPDRAEVHRLLGVYELRRGGDEEAVLRHWRRARRLDAAAAPPPEAVARYRQRFGREPDLGE